MRLSDLSAAEKRDLLKRLLQDRNAAGVIRQPLSYGQQALWFLHQLEPTNAAYTLAFAARVRGALDPAALDRALQALGRRHDSLRSTVAAAGGIPYREIRASTSIRCTVVDASAWSEGEIQRRCEQEVRVPFDLETGPLMRWIVYQRSHDDAVLVVVAHHIVGDFWSLGILFDELSVLYGAQGGAGAAVLPDPAATYGDFVRWQRDLLAGGEGERLEAYWCRELAGDLPALNLPLDRPRPPVQTFNGARHAFRISEAQTSGLKRLASEHRATLFMVLLAAYEILLHRSSGQDAFLVGLPVAGRSHPAFRGVVGFFVNMVVVRADLAGDPAFPSLLADVNVRVAGALDHQDYPFARLVERLAPARDASRPPFLQATLVLQRSAGPGDTRPLYAITQPGTTVALGGVTLESLGIDDGATQFDLTLFAEEVDGALVSALVYNRDLFEPATIARLSGRLQHLVDAIVANPSQRVSALIGTDDSDRARIEAWSSGPVVDGPPRLVHRAIEAQARATPTRTAVRADGQTITYEVLDRRANAVAAALRARGVGPDVVVGLRLERSLELVAAILGVLKAGGAYLPLDSKNPPARTDFILADAGVGVVLTTERAAAAAWRHGPRIVLDVRALWTGGAGHDDRSIDVHADTLAYVLYTSGSTGEPKGVMVPHRALANHMAWMQARFPLNGADRVLQKTPFSFDASVWEFFAPLMQGAGLVMARPGGHEDAGYLARVVAEEGITTLQVVPSLLQILVEEPELAACRSLRRVFCGGESLPRPVANRFHERSGAELINLYGPTEACIDATFWCAPPGEEVVRIGTPIDNVQCQLLDRAGRPAGMGIPGELYIGGAGLARGYLHRPDLTAERFVPDAGAAAPGARLYRTGDLVRWCADGTLEFLGRADRQVKLRGFRVELDEIERVVNGCPGVRQAAVLCDEHAGATRLVAYVGREAHGTLSADDLRESVRAGVPEYMVPSAFVFLDRFPLTASGKVDYHALPPPSLERSGDRVAPRTATEAALAAVWGAVLGIEAIGVHDNFFELGGDSLRSLQIVAHARRAGLAVTAQQLLRFQTIADLARVVAPAAGASAAAPRAEDASASMLVPLSPTGTLAPLFCVHGVEGAADAFAALAGLLDDARPVYGIDAPELREAAHVVRPTSVEHLAAMYVDAIRSRQPRGPYALLGWSMGAAIAYEMARQLRAERERVEFVGLIDHGARPHQRARTTAADRISRLLGGTSEVADDLLERFELDDIEALLAVPLVAARIAMHPEPARARRLLEIAIRNERALRQYVPPPANVRVWLFRAAESSDGAGPSLPDTTLGWSEIALEGVDVRVVPGDHFTVLRFPHVRELARAVAAVLGASYAGTGPSRGPEVERS